MNTVRVPTVRIALALLAGVPAALAYPWRTSADRWLLGAAVAVIVLLLGAWRGRFFTTAARQRLAIWRRNRSRGERTGHTGSDPTRTTAVLQLAPHDPERLPLAVLASYLHRYGVRCDAVRVTEHECAGRITTWVGLTVDAAANLAALQARSPQLPLHETAAVIARRLAGRLREIGWDVTVLSAADPVANPVPAGATETWRGLRDGDDHLAFYQVTTDERLDEYLSAVRAHPAPEKWIALEFTGTPATPALAVAAVLRTAERPAAAGPLPGLRPGHGCHGPALRALDPRSVRPLACRPTPQRSLYTVEDPITVAG